MFFCACQPITTDTVAQITRTKVSTAVPPEPANTPTPTPTTTRPLPTPSHSPTATTPPTLTPSPNPTTTPTSTPEPTSLPEDSIWIEAAYGFPDGGGGYFDDITITNYASTFLLIQANGVFYQMAAPDSEALYHKGTLTTADMCTLQNALVDSGIFTFEANVYDADKLTEADKERLNGGGWRTMNFIIHSEPPQAIRFGIDFMYALAEEPAAAWQAISTVVPMSLEPYHSEGMIIHIEEDTGEEPTYNQYRENAQPWPTTLPPLVELSNQYFISRTDEQFAPLFDFFGYQPTAHAFVVDDITYLVATRPLLPQEMPGATMYTGERNQSVKLPFSCAEVP